MKILFLNHNIKGRGTYVRCFQFAKNLVKLGNEVTILTSTPNYIIWPKKEYIEGVELICMPELFGKRLRNGGLGMIDTLFRCVFLFFRKYDIVQGFDHRPNVLFPSLISKYFLDSILVSEWTDLHGSGGTLSNRPKYIQLLIGPYENYTEKKSKLISEKLIVISKWLGIKAQELGVSANNIEWIPGGADVDKIKLLDKKEARKIFNLPLDAKIIVYTGYSHYDMEMMLRAVSEIQIKRSDVWLVTTGEKLSLSMKEILHDSNRVIELGFIESGKYELFLPAADVFLFPFKNRQINLGRWPNKIGDYMAAGRPIVSNRTGEMIELFDKYEIGLLASEDPMDIAKNTLLILEDNVLADRFGSNARNTAVKYFDWYILSQKLEQCFEDVLKQHKNFA